MFDLKAEAHTVAQSPVVPWQKLSGATVLITGVTGLIGSACARVLLERNRTEATGIRVVWPAMRNALLTHWRATMRRMA